MLLLVWILWLGAEAPTAREVVSEVLRRTFSATFRYEGRVSVEEAGGARSEKAWRYERLGPPGNSKLMIRFRAPAEIRGVALLLWNEPRKPTEMWLYTPATARTRRIARQDRSVRFAGTGLSFEDLEEEELSRWEYTALAEETRGGEVCYRLEARPPAGSRSQYDRFRVWVSKTRMAFLAIEKSRGGQVVRRIEFERLEQRQNIWTPMETVVHNLAEGSVTRLRLDTVRYGDPLPASSFSLEAMKGPW